MNDLPASDSSSTHHNSSTNRPSSTSPESAPSLSRSLGLGHAILLGLGSILGTGVFVSLALATELAGPAVLVAITLAAGLAACNGLNSAQLAANHPVSGGTYEYGYRWLHPLAGFAAGWTFLIAKSASAATAALGMAAYLLALLDQPTDPLAVFLGLGLVALMTLLVASGLRRSSLTNALLVLLTCTALGLFVVALLPTSLQVGGDHFLPFFAPVRSQVTPWSGTLEATALVFVAFTGYGRIATLGEEVHHPRRTIPRAIAATLMLTLLIYISVAGVAIASLGAPEFVAAEGTQGRPLQHTAERVGLPRLEWTMAVGAVTAMGGVLLNLLLGLSRVVLAMGRRNDLPAWTAQLDRHHANPVIAVVLVGIIIGSFVLVGDVRLTWSFSAWNVLIYYSLTNLAALQLTPSERLYPRWLAALGLFGCLFLAFWITPTMWLVGSGLLAAGLLARTAYRHLASPA